MYPKRHGQFFEQQQPPPLPPALVSPKCVGTFTMQQAVSTFSVSSSSEAAFSSSSSLSTLAAAGTAKPKYKASDFYGRCFILTVEPIATTTTTKRRQQKQRHEEHQLQPMENDDNDLRAMPIQFYSNNTFQALHTNKILRGRFGVSSTLVQTTATNRDDNSGGNVMVTTTRDELWFQVSLFGSGRSVRGSVYSEGIGLSHHDQRSYVGEILQHNNDNEHEETTCRDQTRATKAMEPSAQTGPLSLSSSLSSSPSSSDEERLDEQKQKQRLFVAGSVTYGSDLGSDARPEPVGTFLLTEITAFCEKDGVFGLLRAEDDDDDDADDKQENTERPDGTRNNENSDSVFQ
jgi:hypothetical protein